jgi:tetratricopeptide (TPR) repeat protein
LYDVIRYTAAMPNARQSIPLLIIAAGLLAYHNSFTGPFVFDAVPTIQENLTIRRLWPPWQALSPPHQAGTTVEGRPIVSLSFAINYALDGLQVWGYHATNLAIHIAAALVLFGAVRRTLLQPPLRQRFGPAAQPLALAIAVIWLVHPLQTESVTYVVQRTESMMGLFYLLTLYCVIRAAESDSPKIWHILSVVSCLLGMGCKEVMVSAPLIVFLYDRTFLSGSFAEAWQRRSRLYLSLAATWILLGYLAISTGTRGGTAGTATVPWQAYALTQSHAIAQYLRLVFWPHPLIFDYGDALATSAREVVPGGLLIIALLIGTIVAVRRWPSIGFLGVWFFAILAPTSSVLPVASQTIAEHRMYLPLAAVIAVVVPGTFEIGKRLLRPQQGVVLGCFMVAVLTVLTIQRNRDYASDFLIWQDTAQNRPNNPRAHQNLGLALEKIGRPADAIVQYGQALRLKPNYAEPHYNLGNILFRAGKLQEAIGEYEQALRIKPLDAQAHNNLGTALATLGRLQEATQHYERALQIKPDYADARKNLERALTQLGKTP